MYYHVLRISTWYFSALLHTISYNIVLLYLTSYYFLRSCITQYHFVLHYVCYFLLQQITPRLFRNTLYYLMLLRNTSYYHIYPGRDMQRLHCFWHPLSSRRQEWIMHMIPAGPTKSKIETGGPSWGKKTSADTKHHAVCGAHHLFWHMACQTDLNSWLKRMQNKQHLQHAYRMKCVP